MLILRALSPLPQASEKSIAAKFRNAFLSSSVETQKQKVADAQKRNEELEKKIEDLKEERRYFYKKKEYYKKDAKEYENQAKQYKDKIKELITQLRRAKRKNETVAPRKT